MFIECLLCAGHHAEYVLSQLISATLKEDTAEMLCYYSCIQMRILWELAGIWEKAYSLSSWVMSAVCVHSAPYFRGPGLSRQGERNPCLWRDHLEGKMVSAFGFLGTRVGTLLTLENEKDPRGWHCSECLNSSWQVAR